MRSWYMVVLLPLLLTACGENPSASVAPKEREPAQLSPAAGIGVGGRAVEDGPGASSLTLPFADIVTSTAPGFMVTQYGSGQALVGRTFGLGAPAGLFEILDHRNVYPALDVETHGTGPAARFRASAGPTVEAYNGGRGPAGIFRTSGTSSAALEGHTSNRGRAALFAISNSSNINPAVEARTYGSGTALFGVNLGTGGAGLFVNFGSANPTPALFAHTNGTGDAFLANHAGSAGSLAVFQSGGVNQIRFTKKGVGIFNGGTQTGGADLAEAFAVEGSVDDYAPGDVLVISTRSDRRVEKSDEPYSTRVMGVHATKPGVLLTERGVDADVSDLVPVGVIGVIPTNVSAENGAIRRGDLLVTARTAGHAMRAEPVTVNGVAVYPSGSILGKALQDFAGPGTGVIQVLVNVK